MRARRKLFGEYAFLGNYKQHPDRNQEAFFFGLLKECIQEGKISEDFLRAEMAQNHVRHDALEVLANTPDLPVGTAASAQRVITSCLTVCAARFSSSCATDPDPCEGAEGDAIDALKLSAAAWIILGSSHRAPPSRTKVF